MAGSQSLGPINPSWLARLSAHLGINPVRTLSSLLLSIWPGKEFSWVCCREICVLLMLSDTYSVPLAIVEAHLHQALRKRNMAWPPTFSLELLLDHDSHFVLESSGNGDRQVRLMLETVPAPAVAHLYLPPTLKPGAGSMLSPERALLHSALHLTWPAALHDDDEYLAAQIAQLLIDEAEAFPGANRGLGRYSMHLTEVGGCLRTQSNADLRLAQIFPKGQYMKAKRPRLSEFLMKENLLAFFRIQESTLRQSEKVVTLRTEVMLRSLGPVVGLIESALVRPRPQLLGPTEANGRSADSYCSRACAPPSFGGRSTVRDVPLSATHAQPQLALAASSWPKASERAGAQMVNAHSPPTAGNHYTADHDLPDNLNFDDMPSHLNSDLGQLGISLEPAAGRQAATPRAEGDPFRAFSSANVFEPHSHDYSLFTPGLHLRPTVVPPQIRNFWSDAPQPPQPLQSPSPPPAPPSMPTPTKVEPDLVGRLGAIGVHAPLSVGTLSHSSEPSPWSAASASTMQKTPPSAWSSSSPLNIAGASHSSHNGAHAAAQSSAQSSAGPPAPAAAWNGEGAASGTTPPVRNHAWANTPALFSRPAATSPRSPGSDSSSRTAQSHSHAAAKPPRGPLFAGEHTTETGVSPNASTHSANSGLDSRCAVSTSGGWANNSSLARTLPKAVRNAVQSLIDQNPDVLREEHFDSGVVFHLQRNSEAATIAALQSVAQRSDFRTACNMPAYLTHWLMKLGSKLEPQPSSPTASARAPQKVAKPDMRKMPRGVVKAVEDLVESSPWLDWRHFDAGVMKVLQQLANTSEGETLLELQQVEDSELSSVKNMPAYLNKCFNNRLWKARP